MTWSWALFIAIASCAVYSSLSKRIAAFFIQKDTVVNELLNVQSPRRDGQKIEGTVVIAGGGGGGLIVSSILTKHFTKIMVIEPEDWVNTEEGTRYEKPRVEVVDGLRTPYRKRRRVRQFLSLHREFTCCWRRLHDQQTRYCSMAQSRQCYDEAAFPSMGSKHHRGSRNVCLPKSLYLTTLY